MEDIEKNKKIQEADKEKPDAKETPPPTLEMLLEQAKLEIEEWKNKYALAFADLDNQRKAQEKSYQEALKYRAEGFIEKLMPALDAFHLALGNKPKEDILKNYLQGFEYIYNQIKSAIESEGVTEVPIKIGDAFDPLMMHALDTKDDEGPENKVLTVFSKAYRLRDRLIRPAMVIVSKKKAEAKPIKDSAEEPKNEEKFEA
jgi:molecular chaperone GrpE